MAITAHVNILGDTEIKHERLLIEMKEVEDDSKTMLVIQREIFDALRQYGITVEQIKNDISFLTDRGPQLIAMKDIRRSNCFAHLINNLVGAMCSEKGIQPLLDDAKALVKYMKRSGLNYKCNVTLKSHCPTRWSTVHIMLKSILASYNGTFKLLEQRQNSGNPNHRDCLDMIECIKKSTLQKIVTFLEPFKDFTDRIEGDKDVTIHHVWTTFIQINDHLKMEYDGTREHEEDFSLIEGMKVLGRNYINKNLSAFSPTCEQRIAVVLHPKMKRLRKMSESEREETYSNIDDIIKRNQAQKPPQEPITKRNQNKRSSLNDFIDSEDDDNDGIYSAELSGYLRHVHKFDEKMTLRGWWFENRNRYPELFKLFLKISSTPASSAPSERTFSINGRIINDRRTALLPKSVSQISICRNLYTN